MRIEERRILAARRGFENIIKPIAHNCICRFIHEGWNAPLHFDHKRAHIINAMNMVGMGVGY